ncbi:cellulase family glycosylhydrolase [Marinimicrobium locisalis]|uniref:cellulase family glycosylhydrolase n=1 Tax=Marinimicrobium locisalis TaxID=546022 RepID=UPI0032215420
MKKQIGYLAFAACMLGLQACGGSMLGTPDSEKHKLVPDPVEGNEGRPRPSENAPVITSDEDRIVDATGEPILLRGVNLQYGENPIDRINSITSIREVGSNVIRLQLRAETTGEELEAALMTVVEEGMIAVISYWEPEVACAADDQALFGAVNNLWLGEWIDVLVQDRFQPHIMLNLASQWGPTGIFNSYSQGYRIYIDNYKAVIRQVRDAGFDNPIVVDAPGCGRDYFAFLGNRGRELLAADDQENIILSVHGYGSRWGDGDDVAEAMAALEGEDMPVLMSEFGDANMEEDDVDHMEIMVQGAGNRAAGLPVDWQTEADKAAYRVTLEQPMSVYGREVSMDVFLAAAYVESTEGVLGLQMYVRDGEGRYANLGWNTADAQEADGWSTLTRVIENNSSFGWAEEGFDGSAVTQIGLELIGNGKSPEVGGEIRIDNIKVIEASVPETLRAWDFDSGVADWGPASWEDPQTQVSAQDGALALTRVDGDQEVLALSGPLDGISYDGQIEITMDVLVPAAYQAGSPDLYFTVLSNSAGWQAADYLGAGNVTFGEWTSVTFSAEWAGGSDLGIQMGGLAGSVESILVDNITVKGLPEEQTAFEWGTQYQSDFSADTDGWSVLGWHALPVSVTAEEGALVIEPRPSEAGDASDDDNRTIAVQKTDLASVENFNLNSQELVMTVSLMLDEAYSSAPEDFEFRVFIQDSQWENHTNVAVWTLEDLAPGEWVTQEFEMVLPEAFERNGIPQHFGFQVYGISDMPDAPITVGEVRIEGDIPLEVEEDVVELIDFHYDEHFEMLGVDFVEGGLVAEDLEAEITAVQRTEPFGWLAWSWVGNEEEKAVLNLSNSEQTSVDLTERGMQIISGKGGLEETSVPANFPASE